MIRWIIKVGIIALGSLLTLTVVLGIIVFVILNSDSVISGQFSAVQKNLEENLGIKSEFSKDQITPLSGFIFENFRIKSTNDPLIKYEIEGSKLSGAYQLRGIFPPTVAVDHLHIEDLNLQLRISNLPPSPSTEETEPLDLNKLLEDLLSSPPATLEVKNIFIRKINLEI